MVLLFQYPLAILDLNDSEFTKLSLAWSQEYCHKLLMFSSNYHYLLLNSTSASQHADLLYYLLEYYLFDLCSQQMVHNF